MSSIFLPCEQIDKKWKGFIVELFLAVLFEAQAPEPVSCIYHQKWGLHCVLGA